MQYQIRELSGEVLGKFETIPFAKYDEDKETWISVSSREEAEVLIINDKIYNIAGKQILSGFPVAMISEAVEEYGEFLEGDNNEI